MQAVATGLRPYVREGRADIVEGEHSPPSISAQVQASMRTEGRHITDASKATLRGLGRNLTPHWFRASYARTNIRTQAQVIARTRRPNAIAFAERLRVTRWMTTRVFVSEGEVSTIVGRFNPQLLDTPTVLINSLKSVMGD